MKRIVIAALLLGILHTTKAQEENPKADNLLKEMATSSCVCIDTIKVFNKTKKDVLKEVSNCIDEQTNAYRLGKQLLSLDSLREKAVEKDGKKEINIEFNMDKDSKDYKLAYFELERYLMANCEALKSKIATNDKLSSKSYSSNSEAVNHYEKGVVESKSQNYPAALESYKKAVAIDPNFAFAWDNLGLTYRKLGQYDEAINAYKKSIAIDPTGLMPLQNIAIVYQYKKDFDNALASYEKLAEMDKDNPEVYYGIGQISTVYLKDYEKGLDNMCKAYNIYTALKSPYRTDAEKIIQHIYNEMKKQGKEDKFNEILRANKITAN